MSRFGQRNSEAAERLAERRRREDSAPRLLARVPKLDSLKLEIQEVRAGVLIGESTYVKRVPVEHAPALFDLPCLDNTCKDGGHDVSHDILRALESGQTSFEGEDACNGHSGNAQCRRVLRYVATATYKS